jgi:hypothetical protein
LIWNIYLILILVLQQMLSIWTITLVIHDVTFSWIFTTSFQIITFIIWNFSKGHASLHFISILPLKWRLESRIIHFIFMKNHIKSNIKLSRRGWQHWYLFNTRYIQQIHTQRHEVVTYFLRVYEGAQRLHT